MTIEPTGRRELRDGTTCLVLTRDFAATVDDVWAAVTDPVRMARWIGTWSGDPASGEVAFRMTAEGDDVPEEPQVIEVCEPPHRLVVRSRTAQPTGPDGAPEMVWRLTAQITATADGARLVFTQDLDVADAGAVAENVAPGWEYYLDRLGVAIADGEVGSVDWDEYYPAQSAHYRALFG